MIELMLVVAIIMILATAGTLVIRHVMTTGNIRATQSYLERVRMAASAYHEKLGLYPDPDPGSNLYGQLTTKVGGGPFLEGDLAPFTEKTSAGVWRIMDAWGEELQYEVLTQTSGKQYGVKVTSYGPDGAAGGGDDLYSTTN